MCQKCQISRYSVQRFSCFLTRKDRRRDKQAKRFYKEPNRVAKQGHKKGEANYRGQKIIFCVFKHHVDVSKNDEATGEWRLHTAELCDLYSAPNITRVIKSRRIRWVEHLARAEYSKGAYRSRGKKSLGRHGFRRDDNIKMDIQV
jgi:hypothetical protein